MKAGHFSAKIPGQLSAEINSDALGRGSGRVERYRAGNFSELDVTLPVRPRRYHGTRTPSQPMRVNKDIGRQYGSGVKKNLNSKGWRVGTTVTVLRGANGRCRTETRPTFLLAARRIRPLPPKPSDVSTLPGESSAGGAN